MGTNYETYLRKAWRRWKEIQEEELWEDTAKTYKEKE
jgi:hypothetical protein